MFSTLGRTTARAATKAMARAPSAAAAPAAASVACLNMVTGMAAPAISAAPKAAYHTTAPTLDGSGRLFGAAPIEDAEAISHIGFAFMGSKVLFAALELEVFTTLSPEHGGAPADGMTLEAMAAATSVDERSLTTLTTALLSMGLLAKVSASASHVYHGTGTGAGGAEGQVVGGGKGHCKCRRPEPPAVYCAVARVSVHSSRRQTPPRRFPPPPPPTASLPLLAPTSPPTLTPFTGRYQPEVH